MKPFTIAEYQKDPSKLSSRLKPDVPLSTEHAVLFGDKLAMKEPGGYIGIYTEREAAERFVLRTQYRELRFRPWKDHAGKIWACPMHNFTQIPSDRWVGPEQTILIED